MDNEGNDGRRVEARSRGEQVEQNRCEELEGPALASCGIRRRMASIMLWFLAEYMLSVVFCRAVSRKSPRRWKVPHARS